jgi:hypothetical protein
MAKKDFEFGMPGVGELDHVMHNQGVSDLSWLSVNEEEYRALETLPKQNLDIIPELQKALAFDPKDSTPSLVPLKPHVMVNVNPSDKMLPSEVDMIDPIRNRVATMVMKGYDDKTVAQRLYAEYSPADIKLAAKAIKSVLGERHLLGNLYINASNFPKCSQDNSRDRKIVANTARTAKFVIAKNECSGCVCNRSGQCSAFKKTIVSSVPYGKRLANDLGLVKLNVPTDDQSAWKEAIRSGIAASESHHSNDGVKTVSTQQPKYKPVYDQSTVDAYLSAPREPKYSGPSSVYFKYARRMMEGHDDREFLLASGDESLKRLALDYGLLGKTYLDLDAFESCKDALNFVISTKRVPSYVLRRHATCGHCHGISGGACDKLCSVSKFVTNEVPYNKETLASALKSAVRESRLDRKEADVLLQKMASVQDIRPIVKAINTYRPNPNKVIVSNSHPKGFYGSTNELVAPREIDELELENHIGRLLNLGYSGTKLASSILSKYSKEDLKPFSHVSARHASNVGIQGHYFLDPTVYSDYGKGCAEGAGLFRKKGALNVLASTNCTGCTLQTSPGWCSKYSKTLIRSVPESVVASYSKQLSSLPVVASAPVRNPVSDFDLRADLDISPSSNNKGLLEIEVSPASIGD